MPKLTLQQRSQIAVLSGQKKTYKQIMKTVGCCRTAIVRWKNEFKNQNTLNDKKRPGRPKKVNAKITNKIIKMAKGKRKQSTRKVAKTLKNKNLVNISHETVRKIFKNGGLKPYKRRKQIKLLPKHIQQRKQWYSKTKDINWSNVVFSDEKMFYLIHPSNSKNDIVWTTNAQEVLPNETSQYSSKIHVCGAICAKGKTDIVFIEDILNAENYIEILNKTLLPKMNELYESNQWSFMQDHAKPHDASITQQWLSSNVPNFWDANSWPAKSPDLNPIENLWSIMEERIDRTKIKTIKSFKNAIKKTWNNIQIHEIQTLVNSMNERRKKLKEANYINIDY
jgi:transposase